MTGIFPVRGWSITQVNNILGTDMTRISEYRALEEQIAQHTSRLAKLKVEPALKAEIEFETKLKNLLQAYSKSLLDVIAILDPPVSRQGRVVAGQPRQMTRRPRLVKVYRNPLTGEIVESKGGNNKLLGAWKAQFGHEEVESWVRTS